MCRIAAYIGHTPRTLATLLYDPPHSLQVAAYAPKELLHGNVNVDGTGVAWWAPGASEPLRYVTDKPPWSDPNLPTLAPAITGTPIIAGVRGATPGIGFGSANVAPFISGDLAGIHNGWIRNFHAGVGRSLTGELSEEGFGELSVMNDSLTLFQMTADFRREHPESPLVECVSEVVRRVAKTLVAAGQGATLNLVVGTSTEIVAVRTSVDEKLNSLYILESDGVWVASEPLDPADPWQPVADHTIVRATASNVETIGISHEGTS